MLPTFRKNLRIIALGLLFLALFSGVFFRAEAVAPVLITFEDINTNGLPFGTVTQQYANLGVTFKPVLAKTFEDLGPGFTHSGKLALALCEGQENCISPLDVSFTSSQRRVKLWIGYSGPQPNPQTVIMRAFDGGDTVLSTKTATLGPSTGPIPITIPMEVSLPTSLIARVTVGFGLDANGQPMFNNGLSIDDLEFDTAGPAPTCPTAQAPFFTLTSPANGQFVSQNRFTVEGSLPSANQDATFRIEVHGQGQTRTYGPLPISPGQISQPNIGDLLFPGSNSLVFIIADCGGSYSVQRTINFQSDVARTPFLVIDENNIAVPGAEIFVDGNLKGRTDQNGTFTAEPGLPDGTQVVARKFIGENPTYRNHHKTGSTRDWNFRAYISNLEVGNDGTLTAYSVTAGPNPLANQVIRVLRRNALIGLHLVVTTEWDASEAEMKDIRQKIEETSRILYNATDGQILIEQAEIVDDARYWWDADVRIYANQSLQSNVPWPLGAFLGKPWYAGSSRINLNRISDAYTLAHEFGHYGFGLDDEYEAEDGGPATQCTALVTNDVEGNPYRAKAAQGSCMMYAYGNPPKFCSDRPENRHLKGTDQGNDSCWKKIAASLSDCSPLIQGCANRWILQTPDSRGAIPGLLHGGFLPVSAWLPRTTLDNAFHPNLCQPMLVRVTENDGTPIQGREVRVFTDYFGNSILQGKTNPRGEITVTGMHIGDRVNAERIDVCLPTARTDSAAIRNPPAFLPINYTGTDADRPAIVAQQVIERSPAFNILTKLKPHERDEAKIFVQVQTLAGEPLRLAKKPYVKMRSQGTRKAQKIHVHYNASEGVYVGETSKLPIDGEVEIEVTATNDYGQVETVFGLFTMTQVDPKGRTETFSADGQYSLRIPAELLPSKERISIGPGSVRPPILPRDYEIVSGPFSVQRSNRNSLPCFGRLDFQLSGPGDKSGMAGYERQTFSILRYNPDTKTWDDVGGIVHPQPIDVVSLRTTQLGDFVLVARKEPDNRKH